jgi:hypothetical protein
VNDLGRFFVPDDSRDAMRKLGGLLLGLGLLMIFVRKSTPALGETWGDWGLLLLLLVTFGALYGLGMLGRRNTAELRPWESVLIVFGIFVAPLVLLQFVEAVGGTPGASLNIFWIFAVTAALAAAAADRAGIRFGMLLAAIAVIVSWSALWNKILSDGVGGHFDVYRILLLIIAGLLLWAGWAISQGTGPDARRQGGELVTGALIAAVVAGSLSVTTFAGFFNPFADAGGPSSAVGWEIILLVVSLAGVAFGSRIGARGPAYIGGIGLFVFLLVAGYDLNSSTPHGKILGWPLILLILGVGILAAGLRPAAGAASAGASAAPPAQPPGDPPPPTSAG